MWHCLQFLVVILWTLVFLKHNSKKKTTILRSLCSLQLVFWGREMKCAPKLLSLTSQTKMTLTVTLTLTDTVTLIFMHTSLTPIKRFYSIYNRNFSRRCKEGFVGVAIFCTSQQLHDRFADVAVLSSENASDKKSIVHTLTWRSNFAAVSTRWAIGY